MPKYALVEEAASHCWGKNFMEPFRQFYLDNADIFYDAPLVLSGEQNLEYYSLYQKYLKLYEANLSAYVKSMRVSEHEFYRELDDVKNDPEIKDKKLLKFVEYLVACTDYESFYKVMVRAAKKLRAAEGQKVSDEYEARADAKGGSSHGDEAKSPSRRAEGKDYK